MVLTKRNNTIGNETMDGDTLEAFGKKIHEKSV